VQQEESSTNFKTESCAISEWIDKLASPFVGITAKALRVSMSIGRDDEAKEEGHAELLLISFNKLLDST